MIRTLIVEDEILARLGLHQLVDWNALGFELLEDAKTGKEAIDTIKLQHPQVILLDLNIPEMDGIQIQKYIQEHHLRCYTIVVSCNDEFATVKDVMRYGAYDFLRKLNLTPEALTSVLLRCKNYRMKASATIHPVTVHMKLSLPPKIKVKSSCGAMNAWHASCRAMADCRFGKRSTCLRAG